MTSEAPARSRPRIVEMTHLAERLEFEPPRTREQAQAFYDECGRRIQRIEAQLSDVNFRERIGVLPEDKDEITRWHKRALAARSFLQEERAKARAWIKANPFGSWREIQANAAKQAIQASSAKRPAVELPGQQVGKSRQMLRRFLWVSSLIREGRGDASAELESLESDVRAYLEASRIDPSDPERTQKSALRDR